MYRKIYKDLLAWKKNSEGKTALLIEGARRVGKSYIASVFGKNEYESFLIIDFNNISSELKDLFNSYLNDLDSFFSYLAVITNTSLIPRKTLIIFDEIQMFPRARGALKYLVADGRFDYIETGSLVSIKKNVKDIIIPSEEETIHMYPMDFEEFLIALDKKSMWDMIENSLEKRIPLPDAIHREIMKYFRKYLIVGGMPQSVQEYISSNDFLKVERVKRNIINLYRNDIAKHTDKFEWKVKSVFDSIPTNLKEQDGIFKYSDVDKNGRYRNYKDALFWLEDASIVNFCFKVSEPNIGLKQSLIAEKFKCYMGDTGLLTTLVFDENSNLSSQLYEQLLLGKLEVNEGMFIENIVAQMLVASGNKLYFYSNQSRTNYLDRMEIDFLITKKNITSRHNISVIEVKSGKNYTLNSLKKFKQKYVSNIYKEFVIHTQNMKCENGIEYIPIYMTSLVNKF